MTDLYTGKILAGRYRVDSSIDSGLLFSLCQGTNVAVDRGVTIKIAGSALADFQQTIFDEARKVSRLSHPNILGVTDLGVDDDGTIFVIYDEFDGESLSSVFFRKDLFSIESALDIALQTASACSAAKAVLPIFGNVTPRNILLSSGIDAREKVKVLNFFAPNVIEIPNTDPELDLTDYASIRFGSPEALRGEKCDERSDVYSIGMLLFRMLAGEEPFPGKQIGTFLKPLLEDPPPPLSSFRTDLPDGLETVILTAMAKNPEMRYQTVAEFAGELGRFAGDSEVQPATPAPKHEIWKTAFVVLAGISLLAVALIYATSVKQTNPTTQLQPDANGQPVQPINPATGIQEQNLANMQGMSADIGSNSNMAVPPGTIPGGDGYDPWKNGGQPPPGAPVTRGGQTVTIDPNGGSPFMTNDGPCIPQPSGILLCPAPLTPATTKVKPTPTPKNPAANSNVQVTPTPEMKPSPAVTRTPKAPAKAVPTPTPKPAAGKSGETN